VSGRICPICARPAADAFRPFCSRRCSDVDLQRWLSNRYVVPAEPVADDEADSTPPHDEDED